jgi:hypothetical protein
MINLGQKTKTPSEQYRLDNKSSGFRKSRNYTEVVYIIGDTLADTVSQVRATAGLPKLYEAGADGCYCTNISPKESATIINPVTGAACSLWEVTIEWDNDVGTDTAAGGSDVLAPTARPPMYHWTSETEEETVHTDSRGRLIATPTGEPVALVRSISRPVLEIKRNENFPFDPDTIMDYVNHCNAALFWGAPIGTVKMLPIVTDDPFAEGTSVYVPVTYRFMFKIEVNKTGFSVTRGWSGFTWTTQNNAMFQYTWMDRVLCKGIYYYDKIEMAQWIAAGSPVGTKPKARVFTDKTTGYNIKEILLTNGVDSDTGTGVIEPAGIPLISKTDPHYLYFDNCPTAAFDDLSLQPWWWVSTTTTTT